MKTLFSIVVDSLERVTLHYVHNKRHHWFFLKMTDRHWNCQLHYTELFLAMFEEKQIKILFYPHVCAVHCKWLVLYMVKAGFTTLQSNFWHSIYFQVIVHVHVWSRRKGDSFRTLANLHEKKKRKSRNVEIALSTEELHMSQHFSLGIIL